MLIKIFTSRQFHTVYNFFYNQISLFIFLYFYRLLVVTYSSFMIRDGTGNFSIYSPSVLRLFYTIPKLESVECRKTPSLSFSKSEVDNSKLSNTIEFLSWISIRISSIHSSEMTQFLKAMFGIFPKLKISRKILWKWRLY